MAIAGGLRVGQLGLTLIVQDVAAAVDFYRDVLGATLIREHRSLVPTDPPGPQLFSAEMRLGDAFLCVTMENPRWREAPRPDWPRSPVSAGAPSTFCTLYVDDVDAVVARALAAGATLPNAQPPVQDAYWGDRVAQIHDPAGHVWRLQTRREDVAFEDLPARFERHRAALKAARAVT